MSKTFDESWITATAQAYWKRFVASVTAFAHRYQSDLFLRTEVNIIVLQTAYAALILLLSVGSLILLYREVIGGVVSAITNILTATTSPLSGQAVLNQLEAVRTREVVSVAALICVATAVFGYLVARLALAPARNALAVQKQFIGNIAHELRTPLAILKTNTEVMLLDEHIEKGVRTTLSSNVEELDRISDIINNLLSLNTLVRPEQISFTAVDVGAIIHRVVDKLSYSIRKKRLRIKVKLSRSLRAWGNAAALEQIITNILKNAIQHTTSGEIIIATNSDVRGEFELSIQDTGAGIKKDDLFRIFEPFYRGDRARTRTGGAGSGLGLAIVSELVRLHHGRVSVRSAPDQGTTVIVTLPPRPNHRGTETPEESVYEVFADYSSGRAVRS